MLWPVCIAVLVWSIWWQLRRWDFMPSMGRWYAAWAIPLVALIGIICWWPTWFAFQKTIGLLLMPAGVLWLALIVVRWVMRDERRPAVRILGVLIGLYTVAGNVVVGGILLRLLEAPYAGQDPLAFAPVEAVLVLGGGSTDNPFGRPQFAASGDRIYRAWTMHQAGLAPILVASGRAYDDDLATQTRALWRSMGVADNAIMILSDPRNTSEEIAAFAALGRERGWRQVGIVSSAWHLPRAMSLARRQGLEALPIPADFRGGLPTVTLPSIVPTGEGFDATHRAVWELVGRLVGR